MENALILLLIVAFILAGCAIPVVIGVWFSRRLKKVNADSAFITPVPSWAAFQAALLVFGLLLLVLAREVYPSSSLGGLLQPFPSIVVAGLLWSLIAGLLGPVLFKRGRKNGV